MLTDRQLDVETAPGWLWRMWDRRKTAQVELKPGWTIGDCFKEVQEHFNHIPPWRKETKHE